MSRCVSLVLCASGLLAVGCIPGGEVNKPARSTSSSNGGWVSNNGNNNNPTTTAPKIIPKFAKPRPTGMAADNPVTGTSPYTTGRATQPTPKALEKSKRIWGKAMSAGGGSLTVAPLGGGNRTFYTDENTFIGKSGDKHFYPYPGGLEGIQNGVGVSVQYYNKDGREFASWIAVGAEPFAQEGAPTTKGE